MDTQHKNGTMRQPSSVPALDELGRVQLSKSFYMRDFLYSEIGNLHGIPNIPENPEMAIQAGMGLCENLLEPLQEKFGRIAIRSAYRSKAVNGFGNEKQRAGKTGYSCASNERNFGHHIWDEPDSSGNIGATACIVVPSFANLYEQGVSWTSLAWWIHDHLPYSSIHFFPTRAAFNLRWCEVPERWINSHAKPKGYLTKPGMANHECDHSTEYAQLSPLLQKSKHEL